MLSTCATQRFPVPPHTPMHREGGFAVSEAALSISLDHFSLSQGKNIQSPFSSWDSGEVVRLSDAARCSDRSAAAGLRYRVWYTSALSLSGSEDEDKDEEEEEIAFDGARREVGAACPPPPPLSLPLVLCSPPEDV